MKALSIFTGAGGFDLGAHSAGIEVVRGVELDPHAQATASAVPPLLAAAVLGVVVNHDR
jgi:site-specific DNA-cytosine methylase